MPALRVMSASPDAEDTAGRLVLPHLLSSEGLRGAFAHYGPLVEDRRENRAALSGRLELPILVLSGEHGLPPDKLLEGAKQIGAQVTSARVPDAGRVFGWDNPQGTAEALQAFLTPP